MVGPRTASFEGLSTQLLLLPDILRKATVLIEHRPHKNLIYITSAELRSVLSQASGAETETSTAECTQAVGIPITPTQTNHLIDAAAMLV